MAAAEDVERQVAVTVVVAVEEPAFLMAVQRIVGGIEIERDLRRRLGVGVEEEVDEQAFDRPPCRRRSWRSASARPCSVPAGSACSCRPPARSPSARRELAGQHRHHRVVAQLVVVVEVLVAERDADDALHHQRLDRRVR